MVSYLLSGIFHFILRFLKKQIRCMQSIVQSFLIELAVIMTIMTNKLTLILNKSCIRDFSSNGINLSQAALEDWYGKCPNDIPICPNYPPFPFQNNGLIFQINFKSIWVSRVNCIVCAEFHSESCRNCTVSELKSPCALI